MYKKIIFGLFIISVLVFSGCTQIGIGEDEKRENVLDGCKHYFDGCNGCTVEDDGSRICTERYCTPEEYEEQYCYD